MPYYPGQVPRNFDSAWLEQELRRLAETLESDVLAVHMAETTTEPGKATEGEIRVADGTHWDPGRGAGTYIYRQGEWMMLEVGQERDTRAREFFLGT